MELRKGQIVDLNIESLAFGGAGIGKYQGLTVFVPETMPGDKVKASFRKIKSNYADAELTEIVERSADRVEPRCRYASECGGCQLQFMPYKKQLDFKKQHVIDCFERIGKIYEPPVEDVIACEQEYYFRNKMEFSFGYDADMNFTLGMHVPGRRFDIMDLEECHLESEHSAEILNTVRGWARESGWPPFKYSNGEGFLKSLYIREGKRTGEVMVNLVSSDDCPDNVQEGLEEFVALFDERVTSIYWTQTISRRGQPRRTKETLLRGKAALNEKMILKNGDEMSFDILPQAFFQVNTFQAEILYSQVLEMALNREQDVVFDLFCGTGTIGLFLAKHVGQVLGIELNEAAVKVAKDNAQKNAIFNIDFYCGDVAKVLADVKERPSLIVVDPPRAGMTEKAIKQMNDFGASQIVYVSCNPSTLARDCALLAEYGYKVKRVQPVDMFPHSFHIESVCFLER